MDSHGTIILRIKYRLTEVFGIKEKDIWLSREFEADFEFDSLDIVGLIIWAEEEFSVELIDKVTDKYEPFTVGSFAKMIMDFGIEEHKNIGSSFDSFLKEEGILESSEAVAKDRILRKQKERGAEKNAPT